MSVAARTAERVQARRAALERAGLGSLPLLACLVAASFLVRTTLGWLRATPTFFPDEYIYAELGRSLAETGRPLIRGALAAFPALLQPLLTAPAWLFGDVATSFRVIQLLGALAMSLAAVPVFLLARRLGLGSRIALALAALALVVPDMLYASWVIAEPFAYPLVLAAVAAAVPALVRPGRRTQLTFLAFAALATFARIQFLVLPVCFVAAAVALGLRERRLRAALREQALVLALLTTPLVVLLAAGPRRALGYYGGVLDFDFVSLELAKWTGADAMLLAYGAGWVLVPGAVLGLGLALVRPRSRAELAFGALVAFVVPALLLEAGLYAASGGARLQERYFFYVFPLVALAFALYASRGWPYRLAHGVLAAGLVALSVRIPLAGFSAGEGNTNSPLLFALSYVEDLLGDVGLASLAVAAGAGLFLLVLVLTTLTGRAMTATALGLALAVSFAASAGGTLFGIRNARNVAANVLAEQPSFVDRSGLREVVVLQSPDGDRGFASEHLFWNRALEDVLLLPRAIPPDSFRATEVRIARDGTLLVDGHAVVGPLLVDAYGATVRFRGAEEIDRSPGYRLLRPAGRPRLALYAPGLYEDGWLGTEGSVRLWPETAGARLSGRLAFRLAAPAGSAPVAVELLFPGPRTQEIVVAPGEAQEVALAVCSHGPWRLNFRAPFTGNLGKRLVSVRASEPVFIADPDACV